MGRLIIRLYSFSYHSYVRLKRMMKELFINSKGGNIKYDYKDRREGEAQLFIK